MRARALALLALVAMAATSSPRIASAMHAVEPPPGEPSPAAEKPRLGNFSEECNPLSIIEPLRLEGDWGIRSACTTNASGSRLFLQRDPEGYEDSVNLYAGMRWDPVNLRDPTGELAWAPVLIAVGLTYLFGESTANAPAEGDATYPSPSDAEFGARAGINAAGGLLFRPIGALGNAGAKAMTGGVGLSAVQQAAVGGGGSGALMSVANQAVDDVVAGEMSSFDTYAGQCLVGATFGMAAGVVGHGVGRAYARARGAMSCEAPPNSSRRFENGFEESMGQANGRVFQSTDPLVGEVATAVDDLSPGRVVNVNGVVRRPSGGRHTDLDIEFTDAVAEVKSGRRLGDAVSQARKATEATGKPSFIYGPNLRPGAVREARRQGAEVVRTFEELFQRLGI